MRFDLGAVEPWGKRPSWPDFSEALADDVGLLA